jgi:orotate phosphoribosyltransferase
LRWPRRRRQLPGVQEALMELLAGRSGHFCMESGYHSERWFDLRRLFERPELLRPFVGELARRLQPYRAEAICGPMSGGARLAALVAAELRVASLFTERVEAPEAKGLFPVRYVVPSALRASVRGQRVAIVDDAISAGSAARGTHADLLACGAHPVAIGALIVFGDGVTGFSHQHGLPVESVARMPFGMWRPAECPLCRAGQALEAVSDA